MRAVQRRTNGRTAMSVGKDIAKEGSDETSQIQKIPWKPSAWTMEIADTMAVMTKLKKNGSTMWCADAGNFFIAPVCHTFHIPAAKCSQVIETACVIDNIFNA